MSDAALIGQTIAGRFRLTGFIGEGAMATVYRGLQDAEPRDVAVKIMHAHLARDPTFAARFRREAKAAAVLRHPNTVYIVDYGADRDRLYIAMELISGQDLFEMLVLERRFSEARATRIVAQVCDALTAAHARGIIHRDLKPENVMIIQDPRTGGELVKVLDFGIAKVLERDKNPGAGPDSSSDEAPSSLVASALTTVGVVVGTPAYMSPEQCRAEAVDARSDVYSCGILLYQLICGRTPFTGDSPIEIAINQVRMPPDPPSSIVPGIHPQLEQILLKSLEKWPAQRQQSAAEFRDELLAVLPLLADDRRAVAEGKQPPSPVSIRFEDRAPAPSGPSPISSPSPTSGSMPVSAPSPMSRPAPSSDEASDLAATVRKEEGYGPQGRIPASGPHGAMPTLSPRLPASVSGPVSSGPVSSGPFSEPDPSEMFPRPYGAPVTDPEAARQLPQAQTIPLPLANVRPPAPAAVYLRG
ncbi:MAG: protein kinase [Polyangiaceae bacterium]|nr:protein kinase [Polyangiaceae bacterium]